MSQENVEIVRRWWKGFNEDGPRVETEDIVGAHGDGETVLMLLRATGKAAYTGLDIEVEWAAVWTIRNGKLVRAQGYLSRADAVDAAGLSE